MQKAPGRETAEFQFLGARKQQSVVLRVKRERGGTGVQVKGLQNQLERKSVWWLRSRREDLMLYTAIAFSTRHEGNVCLGPFWGCSVHPRSLLLPPFLISEILFSRERVCQNAEGVSEGNPKQQKPNTSLEDLGTWQDTSYLNHHPVIICAC